VTTLSGGERRRVALCRLLLEKPDLLLLDEPTNHLDAESVAWLEHTLHDYAGTVMVVTHDRYFLDNVTNWILEIERGRGYPFEGNYSSWLEQKRKRLQQEEKEESARQRALAAEQEWIRLAARAPDQEPRAHPALRGMLAEIAGAGGGVAEIVIPPGPRLGGIVIEARSCAKATATAADRRPELQAAARRHRRRDRPERRRQDHFVPHDHRPGTARCRHAARRRDGEARLRRPVARQPRRRPRPCGRKSPAART
jgi:ATPase subunit of ABC transporter with duplicated ATPase domains